MIQISVFGQTDKRPCIYTLMKILQPLGTVALVSNNRFYSRLTDGETDGFYQNISIFISDVKPDELWETVERDPHDFDYVIYDNEANEDTVLYIYIEGAGKEERDEYLFDAVEDITVIKMGKGKNAIKYTADMMNKVEHVEYFKQLICPSEALLNTLAKVLSPLVNVPVKTLVKVGKKA